MDQWTNGRMDKCVTLPGRAASAPAPRSACDPGSKGCRLLRGEQGRDLVVESFLLADEGGSRVFLHCTQAGFLRMKQLEDFGLLRVCQLHVLREFLHILLGRWAGHRAASAGAAWPAPAASIGTPPVRAPAARAPWASTLG